MPIPTKTFAEAVEYMAGLIRRDVAAGFDPGDRIAESVAETAGDDGPPAEELLPVARRLVREALAAHQHDQAGWPDRTDCDRLDEAFAELEDRGIVCRQNFSCCGNCGVTEIGGEIADAEDAGGEVRGYAFYHMQSTESAVEGHGVMLHYGAAEDGEAAALAVARELVEVLTAHGLTVDWNGSWNRCVGVALDWKRRRPVEVVPEEPRPTPGLFDACA